MVIALATGTGTPAGADFAAGLQAFDAGDYAAAMAAWQPLAQACDRDAQVALANLYRHGLGRARDPDAALSWYVRAAGAGHTVAQINLGEFHAEGTLGAVRDPVEAAFWYAVAARAGSALAAERRDALLADLDSETSRALARRVQAFRPETQESCR